MINWLGFVLTIFVYIVVIKIKNTFSWLKKAPPIIFAGVIIILIIKIMHINYSSYNKSASLVTFLLGPATIAFAYPFYKNRDVLLTNKRAIWTGLIAATLLTILSTFFVSALLNADSVVMLSMIPKSVTTPIAVEISKSLGGIPELTACIVIFTGLVGGLSGHRLLKLCKIKNDVSIGLSIGSASHILGTTRCYEKNKSSQVAISTLALIIVALLTALIAPSIMSILLK